jgi:hypothetical protein
MPNDKIILLYSHRATQPVRKIFHVVKVRAGLDRPIYPGQLTNRIEFCANRLPDLRSASVAWYKQSFDCHQFHRFKNLVGAAQRMVFALHPCLNAKVVKRAKPLPVVSEGELSVRAVLGGFVLGLGNPARSRDYFLPEHQIQLRSMFLNVAHVVK